MVHKLALGIGAAAAVAVLLVAMGAGSLAARPARAIGSAVAPTPVAAPTVQTQVDTVYVKPVPKAKVIHVTRTVKPTATRKPHIVTITVKPSNGDDRGDGSDGGGDAERDGGD